MPPFSVRSARTRLAGRRGAITLSLLAVVLVVVALAAVRGEVDRAMRDSLDDDLSRALQLAPPGSSAGKDGDAAAASLPSGTWLALVSSDAERAVVRRSGSVDDDPDAEDRPDLDTIRRGLQVEVLYDGAQYVRAAEGDRRFRVRAVRVEEADLPAGDDAIGPGAAYVAAVPVDDADSWIDALDHALLRAGIPLALGVLLLMGAMRIGGKSAASAEALGPITDHNVLERDQTDVAPPVEEILPDAAPLVPNPEPTDLQHLVRDAIIATGVGAETTTFSDAPAESVLDVDPALVREAVDELLDNALRHGGDDVRLDVRLVRAADDALELHVADSGPGMGAAARARALEWPWKEGAGRVGIGFIRAVAEAHGGSVDLAPSHDGGLHVTVVLRAT